MRLGLIGSTGHWQTYAPRSRAFPASRSRRSLPPARRRRQARLTTPPA